LDKVLGIDQKKVKNAMKEKPMDSGPIQYMGGHNYQNIQVTGSFEVLQ
jgi:hypothetical protein